MYRECDRCNGIFKIPKLTQSLLVRNPNKVIYCPYCSNVYSHIIRDENKIITSKRGKSWLEI